MMSPPGGQGPNMSGAYMPVPQPADPRAALPTNAPSSGGGRILAALLVGQSAFVLGFFVLTIIATWIRAGRSDEPASAPIAPSVPASTAPSLPPAVLPPAAWVAVAYESKGGPCVIREQPSTSTKEVGLVATGTEIDVLDTRDAERKWYRVRTRNQRPVLSGWMHRNVLRPK